MNELRLDADFLSLLCSCVHLLAIEGNEVLILDLLWQSSAFQVKDSPDLYSILKIKRMNGNRFYDLHVLNLINSFYHRVHIFFLSHQSDFDHFSPFL